MPIAFDRQITTNQPSAKNATPASASGLLPRSPIPSGCGALFEYRIGRAASAHEKAPRLGRPRQSWVDTVNGVFHRHADGAAETAKRQPTVRLAPGLLGRLRRWERLDAKKSAPQVFVVEFGGAPVKSVKPALATACKLAKVDAGVTAYALRHTCASWLVAKGLPTRKIADFLGTSEAMIIKHYGHLAPDYQNEAALAIGRK